MHQENTTIIHAPIDIVFDTTSRLADWPRLLPHYESVKVLETRATSTILRMVLHRSGIPVRWTTEHSLDIANKTMEFHDLSSILRGMNVFWSYTATGENETTITVTHEYHPEPSPLTPLIERALQIFFINNTVTKTLRSFAIHLDT